MTSLDPGFLTRVLDRVIMSGCKDRFPDLCPGTHISGSGEAGQDPHFRKLPCDSAHPAGCWPAALDVGPCLGFLGQRGHLPGIQQSHSDPAGVGRA